MQSHKNNILILLLIVLVTIAAGMFKNKDRAPIFDEILYLKHAYALNVHGVYGFDVNPDEVPESSAALAPLYPAFLATVMYLDPGLAGKMRCHIIHYQDPKQPSCDLNFGFVKWLQLAIAGLGMSAVWFAAKAASGRTIVATLAVVLCLSSGAPAKFANHFLTEALYLPLSFIYLALCIWAVQKPRVATFASAGLVLGLTALARPSFFHFFFLTLPLFVAAARFHPALRKDTFAQGLKMLAVPLIAYTLAVGFVTGGWIARNAQLTGVPSISVGYSANVLAIRVAFNEMTMREYAAGWLYWFPDFGDKAAVSVFGQDAIERQRYENPEGFYLGVSNQVMAEVHAATHTTATFLSAKEGGVQTSWLIKEKVIGDLPMHIATTILMAWRGMFVEKYFGVLGFLGLVLLVFRPPSPYPHNLILISAMGFLMLGFNAFFTMNIPRYNLFLMMPMAIASSWMFVRGGGFARAKVSEVFRERP